MKKLFVCVPALALAVLLSGSAWAEDGAISSTTLNEMGLGGMQVMSDADAMAVRGRGYVSTFGRSNSSININFNLGPFGNIDFDTDSSDGFRARGRYLAGGEHLSESLFEAELSHTTDVPGVGSVSKSLKLTIGIGSAGGASGYSL